MFTKILGHLSLSNNTSFLSLWVNFVPLHSLSKRFYIFSLLSLISRTYSLLSCFCFCQYHHATLSLYLFMFLFTRIFLSLLTPLTHQQRLYHWLSLILLPLSLFRDISHIHLLYFLFHGNIIFLYILFIFYFHLILTMDMVGEVFSFIFYARLSFSYSFYLYLFLSYTTRPAQPYFRNYPFSLSNPSFIYLFISYSGKSVIGIQRKYTSVTEKKQK